MEYFWNKKEKVSYILGILIILIHISTFANYPPSGSMIDTFNNIVYLYTKECIARLAVPLFFILSGVLFFRNYNNSMYFSKLRSRFRSLFIPYVIWNTICMLFAIITSYTFISDYFIGREKFVISLPNVLNAILNHGCNIPFWFIHDLIIFVILSPILYLIIKNKYVGITLLCALFVLLNFDIGITMPFSGSVPYSWMFFYLLGGIIGRHFFDIFSKKSPLKLQIIGIFIITACSILIFLRIKTVISLPQPVYQAMLLACALSFWVAADLFVGKLKDRSFYSNSFLVFAMHSDLLAVITKLLYLVLPKTPYVAFLNYLATIVLTLLVINLFAYITKRYIPKIHSALTGAR